MEPQRVIGQPMDTDDHGGRNVASLEQRAPLRNPLTIASEYDQLWRILRNVHRDLASTVVLEGFGDELSRQRRRRLWHHRGLRAPINTTGCGPPNETLYSDATVSRSPFTPLKRNSSSE